MSRLFISGKDDPNHIKKIEYRIIPTGAYRIMRNCAGCNRSQAKGGKKSSYDSTGCFRVNANGSKLDVWLIYQCPECKQTYNLGIYERINHEKLDEEEYHNFMINDAETALKYGLDKNIFVRNKATIADGDMNYVLQRLSDAEIAFEETADLESEIQLEVDNPYELRIRTENVIAEVFGISRSKAKKISTATNPKYVGQRAVISVKLLRDALPSQEGGIF